MKLNLDGYLKNPVSVGLPITKEVKRQWYCTW